MIRAYSAFLAWRYLTTRWVNVLGVIGVTVAVWALIVVIAVFSGFISEQRDGMREASAQLLVTGLEPNASFVEVEEILHADDAVAQSAPRLGHYGVYYPHRRRYDKIKITHPLSASPMDFDYVELLGIDAERELTTTGLRSWIRMEGRSRIAVRDADQPFDVPLSEQEQLRGRPDALRGDDGILLSRRRVDSPGLRRGQQIELVSARLNPEDPEAPPKRMRKFFALSGAFETGHRFFDETRAIVPIESLRTMMGHSRFDPRSIDLVSEVALRLREGAEPAAIAGRLQERLRTQGHPQAWVRTWEEQNASFLAVLDQERGLMKLILFAVMLVAAFLIYATEHMMVTQKIKDVGILASMGAARRGVQSIFLMSGMVVAITGCVLGTVLGCLSAYYLNDINDWSTDTFGPAGSLFPKNLYALEAIPYRLEPLWITQVVLGAFIISLAAAWLPARRAARLEPVQALAYE